MRFAAPAHTTSVTISTGPISVEDGHITAPADLSDSDRRGILAAGFTPAPVASTTPAATGGGEQVTTTEADQSASATKPKKA